MDQSQLSVVGIKLNKAYHDHKLVKEITIMDIDVYVF